MDISENDEVTVSDLQPDKNFPCHFSFCEKHILECFFSFELILKLVISEYTWLSEASFSSGFENRSVKLFDRWLIQKSISK